MYRRNGETILDRPVDVSLHRDELFRAARGDAVRVEDYCGVCHSQLADGEHLLCRQCRRFAAPHRS
jgi:hypothetical protein